MLKRIRFLCMGFALVLLAGCATIPEGEIKALNDSQLTDIFARAKDARSFWLTVYQSDNGPRFSGANRLHPEHVASVDFARESSSTAPIITADNGREETFTALIDTSAGRSWFDLATFKRVKAIPLGPPAYECVPRNVNDNIPGYASILTKMRIDQLHIENALLHFRAATGPLGVLARGEENPVPDAILGCDFLKAFSFVQIDYPNHTVVFSATSEYAPDDKILIAALSLKEVEGAYAAEGMLDSDKKTFFLDSAGEFEVAMDNPPSEKLKQVGVGDLVFRNVAVEPSKDLGLGLLSNPRIGRQLLSRFKITFVPKKKVVYFEKPDETK